MSFSKFKISKNCKLNLFFTIVYAALTLLVVLHHEIWADEAQVWQIVRHVSILELFKHLVNEGHPSLFYLINMPFAKMGLSIFVMQMICWISMVLAVYLLLEKSPFNKYTKLTIVTSAGFLYFFPVIARSYSILPLLLFLAAILYQKQKEHPILYASVLLMIANTHVIMFAFVFVLGCYFLYDNFGKEKVVTKSNIGALSIISLGLLTVIVQLAGTESSNGWIGFNFYQITDSAVRILFQFFTNSIDYFSAIQLSYQIMPKYLTLYFSVSIIFLVLFLVLIFLQVFSNKRIFVLSILSIGFQFAIYVFVYSSVIYPTRAFVSFLIILFGYWVILSDEVVKKNRILNKKFFNIVIAIFFVLTTFNGVHFAEKDLKYNYSSSKEAANFINEKISRDSIIIPVQDEFALGVYYYLPRYKFYSIYLHNDIKYMVWKRNQIYSMEEIDSFIKNELKNINLQNKKIYILASDFLNVNIFEQIFPEKYKLIFKSSPSLAIGESYKIYEYIGEIK